MKDIRRKERAIRDRSEMLKILLEAKYVTIAMCKDGIPYLVTLTHGYDSEKEAIYFHCAHEGKKIDILKSNNIVWGQAMVDRGYVSGRCDQLYATTQFGGAVTFIDDVEEKKHALMTMIERLEREPEKVVREQITEKSLRRVNIGRIDINYLSGKKTEKTVVSI